MNQEEVILELRKYSDELALSILSQLREHLIKSCGDENDLIKMRLYTYVIAFIVCHTAESLKESSDGEFKRFEAKILAALWNKYLL